MEINLFIFAVWPIYDYDFNNKIKVKRTLDRKFITIEYEE